MRAEKPGDSRKKLLQFVVLLQRIESPGQASDVNIRGQPESDVFCVPGETTEEPLALSVLDDGNLVPAIQADDLAAVQLRSDSSQQSHHHP